MLNAIPFKQKYSDKHCVHVFWYTVYITEDQNVPTRVVKSDHFDLGGHLDGPHKESGGGGCFFFFKQTKRTKKVSFLG